ncbi:hypothetical protein [Reinekea sp.]|uniref:hypothetical protein n=1 Tax=Reinekea sp. TaxID=1970455 RepID=UPI002A82B681|nr:hypothetical protein [Reinekea sp.]
MGRVLWMSSSGAFFCIGVFWLWFAPQMLALALYSGLAVFSVLVAVGFYLLAGYAKQDAHAALIGHEIAKEQRLYAEVESIADQLAALNQSESAKQASRLMGMLADYRQVIEQKLGDTTITMASYSQETGRVFKLVITNLNDIVAAARSVRTTKADGLTSDAPENAALQQRHALLTQQEARIGALIEQNRELLTALNVTTVEVANIKDIDSFELKESLNRLRELGARAQAFSKD